ncbi:MAG: type I restriction enzyme HsdR N-terminal domain-containing protein, partial [Bacteroidaceae bacterium]|nr:type I restriction enzyme HsdR N-terminal domain-containing protein [Bacteroidaceae bacterium]
MIQLKLPPFDAKIKEEGDKSFIWDPVRSKWVRLTPEEHVRQAFVSFLVGYKGFPLSHIANEQTISLNGMSRRCDSVVYDRTGTPRIIVEYKAHDVTLSRQVFSQISRYNLVLKVDWLIVTNGLSHYCI